MYHKEFTPFGWPEPGFTRELKRLFRGALGCSHMTELLLPITSSASRPWATATHCDWMATS